MNRVIKFRVWDKNEKKMWLVDGFNLLRGTEWVAKLCSPVDPFSKELSGCDGEIMQFTGLHDKNGKEIYEGDILFCQKTYWNDFKKRVVVWDDSDSCFYFRNEEDAIDSDCPRKNLTSSFISKGQREIIGNIHENPELLKSEV